MGTADPEAGPLLRRRAPLPLIALIAIGLVPGNALAHGDASAVPASEEHRLRATETAALGPEHAREHAVARAAQRRRAARLRALTPAARRDWRQQRLTSGRRLAAAAQASVAGQPLNEIGTWSERYGLPDYVMHAALLHTGEVAMWGWLPYGNPDPDGISRRPLRGENWFWDTSKPLPALSEEEADGAFRRDDAPPIEIGGETQTPPLYCSGISFLPDGRLVIAGGNRAFTEEDPEHGLGWKGLDTLFVYDPATRQWTQGPTLQRGRWYPTQVMLPDGRTWIGGGYDELGHEEYVEDAELLDAAASALTSIPAPATDPDDSWGDVGWPGLYPHAWVMPGGKLLIVPREWSRASALFDPQTLTYTADALDPWSERPEQEGATAVLLPEAGGPSNEIVQLGGFAYLRPDGVTPDAVARPDTRVLDQRELGSASPWTPGPALNVGRSYHNTVLLPDGGMVTLGGGAGYDLEGDSGLYYDDDENPDLLNAELLDRDTGTWTLGAAQQSFRAYHSVALLLPDGRVWSAGDDWHEDIVRDETDSPWRGNAEIYSPPYLFGGLDPSTGTFDPNRPAQRSEIADGPGRLGWGEQAAVTTNSDDVASMVLMAPGAATHSIDANQRQVALEITGRSSGLGVTVRLPGDRTTAPPGWYMLFALNRCGTPSHASWVRVGESQPGDPAPGAPTPAAGPRLNAAICTASEVPPSGEPDPPSDPDPPTTTAPLVPPPPSPPLPIEPRQHVGVASLRATRKGIRKRGRIELVLAASGRGRVRVRALAERRGRRPLVLGRGSVDFRRAGRAALRVRVSKAGLAALARPGRLTLAIEATAADGQRRVLARRRL